MAIRHCFPAVIDHCLGDRLLDSLRALRGLRAGDHRRGCLEDFALDDRARGFRLHVHCLALESQTLDRLLSTAAQFVIVRPLVYDRRVVVCDVRDICRLIDDGHVTFGRNDTALDALRSKLICRNETILVRADVVIIIGPIVNTAAPIEARFWRKRRPTDVIAALAP